MNVTAEKIKAIKPSAVKGFVCKDKKSMRSAASLVSYVKTYDIPDGVVDYETQKDFDEETGECIVIIRAMADGDQKVLNKR